MPYAQQVIGIVGNGTANSSLRQREVGNSHAGKILNRGCHLTRERLECPLPWITELVDVAAPEKTR